MFRKRENFKILKTPWKSADSDSKNYVCAELGENANKKSTTTLNISKNNVPSLHYQ